MQDCLEYFVGIDRSIVGFEGLENAQECLKTDDKKEDAAASDEKKDKDASPSPSKTDVVAPTEKTEQSIAKRAADGTMWALKALFNMLAKTPGVLWFYLTHPKDFKNKLSELKNVSSIIRKLLEMIIKIPCAGSVSTSFKFF